MSKNAYPFIGLLIAHLSFLAKAEGTLGVATLEQAFAISSVMSDSDALTFGIADFELKYIVDSDDPNWGNDKSVDFKKSIDIVVLPYTWHLENIESDRSHSINMRVFHIEVARDTEPLQGFTNFETEKVYGGFVQYSQRYQLTDNWYSGLSLGGHLMYYRNEYNYSAGFPPELIAILDGQVFNTSATVLMLEPAAKFGYQHPESWGQWTLHSSNHYLYGQGVGGSAKNIASVNPEGWRSTNGVELKFDVPNLWGIADHIALGFKRIDVGGDMSAVAPDGSYYEASIGWIIDTKNKIPFLDNVGIGLNINYGSSISGSTIVFYYNE